MSEGMHTQPDPTGPLVGRGAELRAAWGLLQRARLGRGQVLGITGEAGIGKSRLAVEIVQLSRQLGFAVHTGACRAHGTSTAYLVWQPIWRSLLEVDAALPAAQQEAGLAVRVAGHDGSPHRAPLLAPVVNVPMADSDLTASLEPQARADLLQSLLLDQMRACAAVAPLVLVLEDCHWIDPVSRDLLELIARDVAEQPVLLVATSRPAEAPPPSLQALAQLVHFTEIRVSQLTVEEAEYLVAERIRALHRGRGEVPRDVVDRIVGSAGGNPFHLEELVNFLFTGETDPRAVADALADPALPDDLFQLVLARTNRLGDGEKTTIEVASVLGTRFPASWIWGSYPSAGAPEQVMRNLERLAELDLLRRLGSGGESEYEFKHAITRDALYANLSPRWRAAMHGRVARFIERAYPDRLPQHVGLLAHHYAQTRAFAKQRLWFRAAADAAKAAFATAAAIGWYERLLALTPPEQTGELLIELGDHLLLAARWGDADQVYNRALEVAELTGDRRVRAEANRGLGSVLTFAQPDAEAMKQAVDRLRRAVFEFDQLPLQDGRGLSRALERLAWAYSELGDLRRALAASERHLYVATKAADPVAISGALANKGVVQRLSGEHAEALELLQEALRVATSAGYRPGVILAANDLAGVLFEHGEHDQSLEKFQQALSTAQQIGDRRATAAVIGNVGECYRRRGEYERASRCFVHAFRIAEEIGDRTGMAIIAENLAATVAAQGRSLEAEKLLTRAIALDELLDAQYWLCEALHQYALLLAAAGRLREAERRNRDALRIAEEQHRGVLLGARLLSFRLRVALGQLERDAAMRQLRELRDKVEQAEEAAVLEALWELDPTQEQLRRDAAELYWRLYEDAPTVENRTAYERLTGVWLEPPPPLPSLPKGISQEPPDLTEVISRLELGIRQLDLDVNQAG